MIRAEFFVPVIYILAAVFYALLGLYAWRRRPAVAVTSFAWVMLSLSLWTFAYGLEIFLPLFRLKLFAVNVEYIGIVGVPVFLFFFALDYTGRSHVAAGRLRKLIWLIPAAVLLLAWTNPLHHLMWDGETLIQAGSLNLLSLRFRIGFWIHIGFTFLLIFAACFLLVRDFLQSARALRLQVGLATFGLLFSVIAIAAFIFQYSPINGLDYTPLFFLPAAVGLAWVTLSYRLSELLSLEHITVLKNMKDGVIVLNSQKRILYINPVMERLIGRMENDVIGQPFRQVAVTLEAALAPYLAGGEHRAEIQPGRELEGNILEVVVSSFEAGRQGASNTVITLRDIAQQKEREGELSRRGSIMAAISMAAEQFLISSDWEKNIPIVLKSLGQAADVCRVLFFQYFQDRQGNEYSSLKYEWTTPGTVSRIGDPEFQRIPLDRSGFDRWLNLLSRDRASAAHRIEPPADETEFMLALDRLFIAAVPVIVEGKRWAFMLYDPCRADHQWTDMELDAFYAAASIIGAAEARARAEQKVVRRQRALNLLHEIVKISLEAGSVERMAQTVVNRLGELIGADGCFMTLWDPGAERTIPVAAYGLENREYTQTQFPPEKRTLTKSVLEAGHTLIIEDTADTPHADRDVVRNFPSKSVLALPMIAKSKKLGAILLTFDQVHHFTADETAIGEQAADLIALALEKYQAMDDARRRADTSETLRKAGIAIAEQQDFKHAVAHILDQLKQVVPYDSASVQLLVGDEVEIVGGSGWKNESDVLGLRFPISGDNPNSVVIQTGKPHRLGDAGKVHKQFSKPPHDHIRSWLGVPLIVQGKITGLLAIDSGNPDDFSEQEVGIALEFANQVAVILDNARILRETQAQAITDPLTGVYNRRGLFQLGEFEFKRSRRLERPFCAMMFDIDRFKKVNDRYGHASGDQILHQLAQRCLKNSRATDLVGRYGGEEFVILLVETNIEAARMIAERLRQGIMKTPFQTDAGEIPITSSIGVVEARITDTLDTLIERADAALYQAKNAGRNRVVVND